MADPAAVGERVAATSSGTYPPWYYLAVGGPVRLFGDPSQVLWYRVVAAALCSLVLAGCLARARRAGLTAAVVLVAIAPSVWFLFGVVNPNSLEIALVLLAWIGVEHVRVRPHPSVASMWWIGAPLGLAVLIRPIAAVAAGTVGVALVVLTAGTGALRRRHWAAFAGPLMAAVIASIAWSIWSGMAVDDGRVASDGSISSRLHDAVVGTGDTVHELAGSLGWLEFTAPWPAVVLWWVTVVSGGVMVWRRPGRLRWAWLSIAASVLLVPIVFETATAGRIGFIWQGRYSMPTALGLVVVGAAELRQWCALRPHTWRIVGAVLAEVLTFWWVLRRYTVGTNGSFWFHGAGWHPVIPPFVLLAANATLVCWAFIAGNGIHVFPSGVDATPVASTSVWLRAQRTGRSSGCAVGKKPSSGSRPPWCEDRATLIISCLDFSGVLTDSSILLQRVGAAHHESWSAMRRHTDVDAGVGRDATRDMDHPRRRGRSVRMAAIAVLTAMPSVAVVDAFGAATPAHAAGTTDTGALSAIAEITGAQDMWKQGYTGDGIGVALLDTGVARVPGLDQPGKVIDGPDLSFDSQDPNLVNTDAFGHGTHMAGIIAGSDVLPGATAKGCKTCSGNTPYTDTTKFVGIAPGAHIVNVKVGAYDGSVDVTQIIAGIDWVVQHRNDPGMNIRVLNLSFGTDTLQSPQIDPLVYAVEQAWNAGIVVVAAAGNDGDKPGPLADPAVSPSVIAVGSTDPHGTIQTSDDTVAEFAQHGTKERPVDVAAPGVSVLSLAVPGGFVDQNITTGKVGTRFQRASGTSQSTSVVSGLIALLLDKYPTASPDAVKMLFKNTGVRLDDHGGKDKHYLGSGLANVTTLASLLDGIVKGLLFMILPTPTTGKGTGSLEDSRGTFHVEIDGTPLVGEVDIFGQPWNATAMAKQTKARTTWSGSLWNGSTWAGDHWEATRWARQDWTGNDWTGQPWSGARWTEAVWSGARWSGARWSGARWSGARWTSAGWDGARWSGARWSGARWSDAGWS